MMRRATLPGMSRRGLAAAAAVAPRGDSGISSPPTHSEVKLTRLPNQMMVTSIQTPDARIAKVGVAFRAGSRYDDSSSQGMAHRVASLAGLGTQKDSKFGISNKLANAGAELVVKHTRDLIIYSCNTTAENRKDVLKVLSEMVCEPGVKQWELAPSTEKLVLSRQAAAVQPSFLLDELAHRAAYRGRGLGLPLLTLPENATVHSKDLIKSYLAARFTPAAAALIGVNVDHDYLLDYSADSLPLLEGKGGGASGEGPYKGGEEHAGLAGHVNHGLIVGEGASWQDAKAMAIQSVLAHLLGGNVAAAWAGNGHGGLATAAIAAKLGPDTTFSVSGYTAVHADSGLVGLRVAAAGAALGPAISAAVGAVRALGSAPPSAAQLEGAKKQAAMAALTQTEKTDGLVELSLSQALSGPNFATPADLADAVLSVTAADVQAAAKKWVSGKPTLATVGDMNHAPYLDQVWS